MASRLLWLRRDLRLHDHPALFAAGADGADVVPVFVADPRLLTASTHRRAGFVGASLAALSADMDGALRVASGDPRVVIPELAQDVGVDEVHITADAGRYGSQRDAEVAAALADRGIALVATGSPYAVSPGRVTKSDGTGYSVFTPFYRAWRAHGWRLPAEGSAHFHDGGLPTLDVHDVLPVETPDGWPAGERAALERWRYVVDQVAGGYHESRNRPDLDGSSRLSPYLKVGAVHPRTLLADLGDGPGDEALAREIAWREFYADLLARRPDSSWRPLRPAMADLRVDTDDQARELFAAWCAGHTGYPLVDAGMRQLLSEGWMHNRVRMITASFLVKDLHLPWQWGARHFMRYLIDGDTASNAHGWQWVAGTGTDSSPFVRVFNPIAQARRFDPDGAYVRCWVPELRDAVGDEVFEPWATLAGQGYCQPIVDHALERIDAIERYAQIGDAEIDA